MNVVNDLLKIESIVMSVQVHMVEKKQVVMEKASVLLKIINHIVTVLEVIVVTHV